MPKYFIYVRKSTDEEDRQILSIEGQLAELKEFAAKEKLEIAAFFTEAKTAKEPGRAKLGEMLTRIENGEADGIISWHPDRLARNPIDGGKIIYLVDTDKIKSLKFPTFWFENTPQGKFMLNIAFGQSKYFIDNLSENVKRGIRQKLRRGEWPGPAPLGYLNDFRKRNIIIDQKKHKFVKRIFELYSTGDYTLAHLTDKINELGLRSQRNKLITLSMVHRILKNSFYYGVFKIKHELYQASHEPIISKKLFDEVQGVMNNRGYSRERTHHNFIFTGLMKCSCGCSITAETKKGHIYYRCTKKKQPCDEKYIREESLVQEFKDLLQKVSIPDDWACKMIEKLDQEKRTKAQASKALVDSLENQVRTIDNKLDKLLDYKLEGIVDKADYLKKKEQLIKQKLTIQEKIHEINNKGNNWLEPMRDFILASKLAKKIAQQDDLMKIKTFLKKVGSNFILKGKKIEFLVTTSGGVGKIGWRITTKIAEFSDWCGVQESNLRPSA